jgi:kynurenine formamidase
MPKNRRFVDLSIAIEDGLPSDPPELIPRIEYMDHKSGIESVKRFFPNLREEDLPGGLGWAFELIHLATHSGTHLDSPWHYHPTMDKGKRAITIDEVPLEWCFGPGCVFDFRHKKDGEKVTAKDMDEAMRKIGYNIKEGDIVLIMTGADRYWGKPEYLLKGCGMTRESTLWILDRGVKVVGIDAWSWDRPLPIIAREYEETGNKEIIWEAHFAGIEKGYLHMEKLCNLDKLPPYGFTVSCFPIKIKGASAGWTRAVAIIDE